MEQKNADKDDRKIVTQYEENLGIILEEVERNRIVHQFDEQHYENLDSSMKKNTSFAKKIKLFNDANLNVLLQEIDQLNLNNYLEEIALGLFDCKFKMTSVPSLVLVLGKIHRNYANFNTLLFTVMKDKLTDFVSEIKKSIDNFPREYNEGATMNKELQSQLSNLILIFHLYCETLVYGIVPKQKYGEFYSVVRVVLKFLFFHATSTNLNYLVLVVQLFKHVGVDFVGVMPRRLKLLALQAKSTQITQSLSLVCDRIDEDIKVWIRDELETCYEIFSKLFIEKSEQLYLTEQTNNQIIGLRGALSQEKKDAFEQQQTLHKKIKKAVEALADILDKDCPLFEIKTSNTSVVLDRLGEIIDVVLPEKDTEEFNLLLWDDTEIKSFYTDLPCIKFKNTVIAKISYFDFKSKMTQKRLKIIKANIGRYKNLEFDENNTDLLDYEKRNISCVNESEISSNMMSFITQLQQLVNRDLINNAAIEFLTSLFTTKNRKILIEVLHGRTKYIQLRLGLLPFFSRLIAIIYQVFPEFGYEIVYLLCRDIRYQVQKKNPNNLEYKQKLVKYIGELTLFGVCPKLEAINVAKVFLADFYGHNIDMMCTLLDSCGRYLFVNHDSHQHSKQLLEIIVRKVKFSIMERWHISQLESACLVCNPVAALNYKNKNAKKSKDPLLSYIKYILYTTLNKKTPHKSFQTLLQLPLNHFHVYWYLVKCFARPWKFKFSLIDVVVSMVTAINSQKKHLINAVIDQLLETMTTLMESCDYHCNQKLLCIMVYLGEFYNFGLINYATLIRILYFVLTHKFTVENSQYKCVDLDHNFIRIRMVCELVKTVFPTIDLCDSEKKESLCKFLLFFQCYYWDKKLSDLFANNTSHFPQSIDMLMQETFEFTDWLIPLYDTAEKAKDAFETSFNIAIDASTCCYQTTFPSTTYGDSMVANNETSPDAYYDEEEYEDFNPEKLMEKEYNRLIQDRYHSNQESARNKKGVAINIPYAVVASSSSSDDTEDESVTGGRIISRVTGTQTDGPHPKDVKVKFVGRKNKKPISKEVVLPGDSFLASDILHRKQVELKEMKHIKSLVLNLEKLQTDDNRGIDELYRLKK